MSTNSTVLTLARATVSAYEALEAGKDSDLVYGELAYQFEQFGLGFDVAESAVDWYDFSGAVLIESLTDALERR